VGYAWSDLATSGKAVRNALAVYSLALAVGDATNSAATRRALDEAREWIVALQELGELNARLERDGADLVIHFRFGRGPAT
jgi:hypothetical protein